MKNLEYSLELLEALKQICYPFQTSLSHFINALQKNNLSLAESEINKVINKYNSNETKRNDYIKIWHLFYDYITAQHKNPIYDIPEKIVSSFTNSLQQHSEHKKVIITMTTCKRMDLTYRTINSMLHCITDLEKHVSKFLVVDDNSSEEDRTKLLQCYPFITLIRKDSTQKGHPKSMNIILNEIKNYKYQFHIEDDWEFFYPKNFISDSIAILESDPNYGQCLINRDYGEDQVTINNIGGSTLKKCKQSTTDLYYYEHRHFKGQQLQIESQKCGLSNNLYWPHFSFRVGLTKTEVYNKVGSFNEAAKHFEMEYAERYFYSGYITTFLDRVYCTHIGRRTYERNDNNKKNAYDLNNEIQFGEIKDNNNNNNNNNQVVKEEETNQLNTVSICIYVVNLKRRKDRLLKFLKENANELYSFKIYDAIDGSKIIPNSKTQRLFQTGDYNYRRGIVGVASSMIDIWKQFISDTTTNIAIILEDDVKLTPQFLAKSIQLIENNKDKFDIIFAHMNPYPNHNKKEFYRTDILPELVKYSTERMMSENMGSMAATILTKEGAKTLLEDINKKGVYNAIDWVAMKTCNIQRAFVTVPFLAFADCFQTNNHKDTDIQTEFNTCEIKNWLTHEIEYWQSKLKSKKNNRIRLVTTVTSKDPFIELVRSNGYEVILVKNTEIKQNDIIVSNQTKIVNILQNITILPLQSTIECKTIKYYRTNNSTFCIPFSYINDTINTEKTWGDGYLNMVFPI
jgi:GR25 family glycosyltransferase involved in LPS biosynthesis